MSTVVGQPTKQTYHILVCLLSASSGDLTPRCLHYNRVMVDKRVSPHALRVELVAHKIPSTIMMLLT